MSKIQIICTSPGMRRLGIAHPASEIYPAGRWSEVELKAFRADPAFTVRKVDEAESTASADDFEIRVANEVDRRVATKVEELQRRFDQAVTDLVEEKVSDLKEAQAKHIEELEKNVTLAQAKMEELVKQLEAAAQAEAEKTEGTNAAELDATDASVVETQKAKATKK